MQHNHALSADCVDTIVEFIFLSCPHMPQHEFNALLAGLFRIIGTEVTRVEKNMKSLASMLALEAANHQRAHVFSVLRKTVSTN